MSDVKGTIQWSGTHDYSHLTSGALTIGHYPSGEPLVQFPPENVSIDMVLLRSTTLHDFMTGLFFVDALVERGQAAPDLLLPFVPGARQDRLNGAGDFLFTAKSIAREINMRSFPSVTVLDPHSEVIAALIDRCHVLHAHECIEFVSHDYTAVVSPDAGAEKRAGAVAKKLGLPMLHGWKTRDVATGNITGFGLEASDITGRMLVVDDICDGGGTFIGLAAVLKARSLPADLYVTHGLFTQGTTKLLEHYGRVLCTDSVNPPSVGGLDIIPVCKRLIEGPA